MAKFGLSLHLPLKEACLDSATRSGPLKQITLIYHSPEKAKAPELVTQSERYFVMKNVKFDPHHRITTFTLVVAAAGAAGTGYVYDKDEKDPDLMLRVVVGPVKNHNNFKVDLLAELLGRSDDARKTSLYQAILNRDNNAIGRGGIDAKKGPLWDNVLKDQPLKQITDKARENEWNCGKFLEKFGNDNYGADHFASYGNTPYYKPYQPLNPKVGVLTEIKNIVFDKDKLRRGVDKIRQLLDHQKAVTLFVVHHNGFKVVNGVIKADNHTHFLTVIGCDIPGTTFLVADPWPGGCQMKYQSGIFGDVDANFLGTIKYDEAGNSFGTSGAFKFGHDYTVLTGP